MSNQARRNDTTKCPKHGSGTLTGIPESPNCTGNNQDAVRTGDYAQCVGTAEIDVVVEGAATVTIRGRFATRVGIKLWHGGAIDAGSPNITIGGPTITAEEIIKRAKERAAKVLDCAQKRLDRWNDDDKAMFKRWFGSDSDASRQKIADRVAKNKGALNNAQFRFGPEDTNSNNANKPGVFAHVYGTDTDHNVYLDPHFWNSRLEGTDNQAGALLHEMSHFDDVGGTNDYAYGTANALSLASNHPDQAIDNADNYEYFMENVQESCP